MVNIKLVELFKLVGTGLSLVCCLVIWGSIGGFLSLRDFSGVVSQPRVLRLSQYIVSVESSSLTLHRWYLCCGSSVLYMYGMSYVNARQQYGQSNNR